jgi:hypothetical protein
MNNARHFGFGGKLPASRAGTLPLPRVPGILHLQDRSPCGRLPDGETANADSKP